jgi:hypothetical protein
VGLVWDFAASRTASHSGQSNAMDLALRHGHDIVSVSIMPLLVFDSPPLYELVLFLKYAWDLKTLLMVERA